MNPIAHLGRAEIETLQLRRVNELFAAILPANPFYDRKYRDPASRGPFASLDEFRARVPFTVKSDLIEDQLAAPPYGTNLTEPIERFTRYCQTSGTTGEPLRWPDTPESWSWMVDNWVQIYREMGVTANDRVFFAFSFGPFLGFWTAFDAAERLGCLCISGGGMSSMGRLQTMIANQTTVLCCTPTYALRLAEAALEEGIDPASAGVHKIVVAGEPGASVEGVRARIGSLWNGARLFDHHGMTEIGPVTFESAHHPGVLHPLEQSYIIEVIDPETTRPVDSGETGELILTNLGRAARPLIRYRTGDAVRVSWEGAARYGRNEAAFIGGIVGRYDDMVIVRGVNLIPSAVDDVIRRCGGVAEYRVLIAETSALAEVEVVIETAPDCRDSGSLPERLSGELYKAFNLRIPVRRAPEGALPRFEMKAKRWIRTNNHE
ncbi:MAG: AMP-binding protein [bacterium]|nr:AMP-binding protein [bacterium]